VGALDEVRLYSRALTEAEVLDEASGTRWPSRSELIASWSFNEAPPANVAYDRSGSNNHATLGDGISSLAPPRQASDAPLPL
jgi:hypothetical protein